MKMVNFTINKSPHSIIFFSIIWPFIVRKEKKEEIILTIQFCNPSDDKKEKGRKVKKKKKKEGIFNIGRLTRAYQQTRARCKTGARPLSNRAPPVFFKKGFAAASFHSKTGVGYGDEPNRRRRRRLWFQRRMDRIWMVGRCALNYREYWGAKLPDSSID